MLVLCIHLCLSFQSCCIRTFSKLSWEQLWRNIVCLTCFLITGISLSWFIFVFLCFHCRYFLDFLMLLRRHWFRKYFYCMAPISKFDDLHDLPHVTLCAANQCLFSHQSNTKFTGENVDFHSFIIDSLNLVCTQITNMKLEFPESLHIDNIVITRTSHYQLVIWRSMLPHSLHNYKN